ncbi:MAG: Rieske (2Fe-2S) protein [Phormidium sp. BM_Day4_Bin.17]|nr:Rieske (2Fe-2S) protein [Phormidium sp. BM_Day4_Bin.17]UCJ11318.1 MAG: Rieske (2Fe-2S) protein [Phormidium sp. PBR-2020]
MALTKTSTQNWVHATSLDEVQEKRCVLVQREGHQIALFHSEGQVYAIDNRCPHMGFPLQGSVCKEGILTCPWHYARFDLASGGTFDSWADDVRAFPLKLEAGEIWLNLTAQDDAQSHHRQRLQDGLEQTISLVIAKSVIGLLGNDPSATEPFRLGLAFGTRHNKRGWGSGLTILTAMMNLLPYLEEGDRPQALYQGLSAVARDSSGAPPHFRVHPLPQTQVEFATLKGWFRQFVERRDAEAAERCLMTAVRGQLPPEQIAEMLFAAATDHRYLDGGHTLDFINKGLEALDWVDWQEAESTLASLVPGLTDATRMEESSSWRYPLDLVEILEAAFRELPQVLAAGRSQSWDGNPDLVALLLADNPQATVQAMLTALKQGCPPAQLAAYVTQAAALRVAQFNTNNDHRDWNAAHHPFTYAHAVQRGLERSPTPELLRGVFDGAMAVYLNRFLNVPPARLPNPDNTVSQPQDLLKSLGDLLDRQQQIAASGKLVAQYLHSGGEPHRLIATLAQLMLREDRNFHVIQSLEAAVRLYHQLGNSAEGISVLVAATRYLAAHSPTVRSQAQTYEIAQRLHQGDRLDQG